MATPQFSVVPSDDDAKGLSGDSNSTQNSLAARPVVDRVATPLGLFVSPSTSGQLAMKGLGISMPDTITPESAPSGSPDVIYQDEASKPANDQQGWSTNGETSPERERPRVERLSQILGQSTESKVSAIESTTETPGEPSGHKTGTFDLTEEPLHTGVVRSNTKIVHPKPINRPTPEANSRPGTAVSNNIAQLEATAVRLSMTSSIDDAIRDLHGELKRSDSRRSARGTSTKDEQHGNAGQLMRHLSTSSSIVSTNIAARHGGYSPAGFVMSPNHSIANRLRSGSNPSAPLLEAEPPTLLSRHGPGKSSVRSVRSVKPSLAEISETEPIALTQDVLDQVDAAPPIEEQNDLQDATILLQRDNTTTPSTDAFHKMLDEGFGLGELAQFDVNSAPKNDDKPERKEDIPRPSSTHSNDTFSQARDAFADFDGAYYHDDQSTHEESNDEAEEDQHTPQREIEEEQVYVHSETLQALEAQPRAVPVNRARPQSYMDPETGVQMLYYPARVPAMLNLPPKLSSRTKGAERNKRQSKVLSAMWDQDGTNPSHENGPRRHSAMPKLSSSPSKPVRHSFLPEIRSDYRNSFMPLPTDDTSPDLHQSPVMGEPAEQEQEHDFAPAPEVLRVPKRLSRMDMGGNRKSRASMNVLPSALRASAYFDLPSTSPEIEVKDGSAMATLDSILDASAVAPVSAFTDHVYAGKLGAEVYGKEKKRKSVAASAILTPPAEDSTTEKRRSSFMWSTKRKSNMSLDATEAIKPRTPETKSLLDPADDLDHDENMERDPHGGRIGRLKGEDDEDEDDVIRVGAGTLAHNGDEEEEAEEEEDEEFMGAPTTLLAELQLRKKQQKERTQNRFSQAPLGTRATLLEMDAIAESQRVDRKSKRVNLAWEDPDAHYDQNGSDDEDVPLAIIAAKHAGAKNMADVERPLGLIEKREMEDNEPLSQRRARLQGRDALALPRPPTMMSMAPSRLGDNRLPHSVMPPTPEPVEEIEGETLAERRRRLAVRDGSEISLPKSRPVSRAFSEELLSQFGDFGKDEQPEGAKEGGNAEETLGQRRRRLQAERAAREQEMSYGNTAQARKLGMADVLGAHARKSPDLRVQEARARREEQDRAERERDAKMAAMRMQMPTTLSTPFSGRQSQYGNGMYPNGGLLQQQQQQQQRPATTHVPQQMMYQNMNQQSMYGNMGQQQVYGNNMNGSFGQMNGYGSINNINLYNNNPGAANVYGNGMMQMPMATGSMDRVELWRQGVKP